MDKSVDNVAHDVVSFTAQRGLLSIGTSHAADRLATDMLSDNKGRI